MTRLEAAAELRRCTSELTEAIRLLSTLTTDFDRSMQLARIARLRAIRDAAHEDYRAAIGASP